MLPLSIITDYLHAVNAYTFAWTCLVLGSGCLFLSLYVPARWRRWCIGIAIAIFIFGGFLFQL